MRSRIGAGILAGLAAGLVMSLFMMGFTSWRHDDPWKMPHLIAVMWLGEAAAERELGLATLAGFATHMATSGLMGAIAIPFIDGLPRWRTILLALTYAIASYPVAFSAIISWANPLMMERTQMIPLTVAHGIFGLVLGTIYIRLRRPAGGSLARPIAATEIDTGASLGDIAVAEFRNGWMLMFGNAVVAAKLAIVATPTVIVAELTVAIDNRRPEPVFGGRSPRPLECSIIVVFERSRSSVERLGGNACRSGAMRW